MSFEHDMNADTQNPTANQDDELDQAIDAIELGADAETSGTPFSALGLHEALLRAVKDSGYENATEVQAQAIPPALTGADLMVSSRTGSGKTASFILPALQQVLDARAARAAGNKTKVVGPRVLVLAPTRELAMQVAKSAMTYGRHIQGLRVATVLGGMPYAQQLRALSGHLDILIATPGRLLDHINSGRCKLDNVTMFVLDEADRMLDMGFIDDINFVAQQIPAERQTLMYSATFAGNTGRLASQLMKDPQRIDVSGHTETHENIEQRLHWADNGMHKRKLLEHILGERDVDQAVVFTSTQQDTEWLAEQLEAIGHRVAALHGGMPQGKRNRTLMALRRRDLRVLVATDVAARGIDVPTISHVINFGLPMKAEDYVHRIGRTGRAGRSGIAVTLAERGDISMIKRIQQFTTQQIPVSRIEGLEPRSEEPKIYPSRPGFDRGDRGGFGGNRGGYGGNRGGYGRPQGGGFRGNDRGGFGGDNRFDSNARFERPEGRPAFGERREGGAGGFGGGNRFERPQGGDRPRFGDRPQGDRPYGDRPHGDRPFGDRPRFGDRPQRDGQGFGGPRNFGDRPQRDFGGPRDGGNDVRFDRSAENNDRYAPRAERPAFKGNDNRFEGRPAGKPAFNKGPRPQGGDDRGERGGFVKKGPRKGY
ncbi:DEAD/DEAH box helicase [Mitsuaria sp. GD03876]|uniref:DEAD/DEAH box helicase n=1 Tax=Mitsuaria sp. GD03876 TaxID=2975399 RepID=UPI00244D15C7|nr:DEAD/DEAH box helicase [Mitsuaria sp. GD03876]MDH0868274.1 DEAD/DEAH box helicase [Mitsuaria sp. GD03876]